KHWRLARRTTKFFFKVKLRNYCFNLNDTVNQDPRTETFISKTKSGNQDFGSIVIRPRYRLKRTRIGDHSLLQAAIDDRGWHHFSNASENLIAELRGRCAALGPVMFDEAKLDLSRGKHVNSARFESFLKHFTESCERDRPEFAKLPMHQNVIQTKMHAPAILSKHLTTYSNGFVLHTNNTNGVSTTSSACSPKRQLNQSPTASECSLTSAAPRPKRSSTESQVEELVLLCWEQQGELGDIYEAVEPANHTPGKKDSDAKSPSADHLSSDPLSSDGSPEENCVSDNCLPKSTDHESEEDQSRVEQMTSNIDLCRRMDEMVGELTQK
ncbi:hypothetical protein X801_10521, partial [Opisthorchis viverrini]